MHPKGQTKQQRTGKRLANNFCLEVSIGLVLLSIAFFLSQYREFAVVFGELFILTGIFQIIFVKGYRIFGLYYLLSSIFLISLVYRSELWIFCTLFYLPLFLSYSKMHNITLQSGFKVLRTIAILLALLSTLLYVFKLNILINILVFVHSWIHVWVYSRFRYVDFKFLAQVSQKVEPESLKSDGDSISNLTYKSPAKVLWTRSDVYSSPVVSNSLIYVTSTDGCVYKFSSEGNVIWNRCFDEDIIASPVLDQDENVYIFTLYGKIYVVNKDGKYKKLCNLRDIVVSTPEFLNKVFYVVSHTGKLYAINSEGKKLLTVELKVESDSKPVVFEEYIYVTTNDGRLYKVSLDGKILWKFVAGGDVHTSPAVCGDRFVVFGSNDQNLYAVDFNGECLWKFKTEGEILSSPKCDREAIYFGSRDKNFYCVDGFGVRRWVFSSNAEVKSTPSVSEKGYVYFGCDDGAFYALDKKGKVCWYTKIGGTIYADPFITGEEEIYVSSLDGGIYVFK